MVLSRTHSTYYRWWIETVLRVTLVEHDTPSELQTTPVGINRGRRRWLQVLRVGNNPCANHALAPARTIGLHYRTNYHYHTADSMPDSVT